MKNILLIGLGRFGLNAAKKLRELDHEVLAVDENEERVNDAMPYVTEARIGDCTRAEFLKSLDVPRFDLCIVAIGDDFQSSLEITSLLKDFGAKKVEEIFEYFPVLTQHLKRKGGVLSGGQQQQLAIARALMSDPKILILDEPTEGIQPNIVSDIADILTRYHKEKKVPIIVVEQNLRFARKLGDRFLIMQKGSIVAQGQMDELTDELSKKYMSV